MQISICRFYFPTTKVNLNVKFSRLLVTSSHQNQPNKERPQKLAAYTIKLYPVNTIGILAKGFLSNWMRRIIVFFVINDEKKVEYSIYTIAVVNEMHNIDYAYKYVF